MDFYLFQRVSDIPCTGNWEERMRIYLAKQGRIMITGAGDRFRYVQLGASHPSLRFS